MSTAGHVKMQTSVDTYPHSREVSLAVVSPEEVKNDGITIRYGIHASPFSLCLIGVTERGICKLAFLDTASELEAIKVLRETWPTATLARDETQTQPYVEQVFGSSSALPLPVLIKGTDFQVKVWQALLTIPAGKTTSYTGIARAIGSPKATRAVGTACGANPIGFIIPCHRVLTSTGTLGGYHWGVERKRAMLAWEAFSPSRQKEILRYFSRFKTPEARARNVARALHVLSGKPGRFMARSWRTGR